MNENPILDRLETITKVLAEMLLLYIYITHTRTW